MNQFEFYLDNIEMTTSIDVTGCIRARKLYALSPQDSSISVSFANLNLSCSLRLDVDDHPACLEVSGEVPVSLTLEQNKTGNGYIGKNLKVLHNFETFEHLPYNYVPIRDLLTNTQQWLDTCPYDTLKNFAYQVLGNPSIGGLFFGIPASKDRHFSEPGGLVKHSLEVAQMVYASTACFAEHERWLAAVVGLFHEVGRVRLSTPAGVQKATAGLVSCEVLNFEVLSPALQLFEKEWLDGAEAIRYMLDNLCRVRKSGIHLPITASIRSADLMSMMNNQREQAFQDKPQSEKFARVAHSAADMFWQPSAP
ncbi:TraI domain-containing protein [Denitrificimonas caeni]|uniref:TraI domain-containing protein n=1 Tax=Denitrificimonas caeni TaxID=521720 RepID=UPI0003B590FC|nr:TraI domain-containing protein [Denitrificimonas caeni]